MKDRAPRPVLRYAGLWNALLWLAVAAGLLLGAKYGPH